MKPNIYLDIDGVLLANEFNPAKYADEFIQHMALNFPTYWLTTHCHGDSNLPIQRFGHLFETATVEAMKHIKPTKWINAKTEAIDFDKPFFWLDDDLYSDELKDLGEHDCFTSWIEVDLSKDQNQLKKLLEIFSRPPFV